MLLQSGSTSGSRDVNAAPSCGAAAGERAGERTRPWFLRQARAAAALLEHGSALLRVMPSVWLDDLRQRWNEFAATPALFESGPCEPVLTAVLLGPSGAGKSTLFALLTGVPVPAGNEVRPLSRHPVAAVPPSLHDPTRLAAIFPGYRYAPLEKPEQAADAHLEGDVLFYAPARADAAYADTHTVLCDIPDFNTVERANWDKADRMIARADLALFVVYPEAYKDERSVSVLRRCCRSAGHMALILTKTEAAAARRIARDLLDHAAASERFAEQRHDGRTLSDFLAQAPFYASPLGHPPHLVDLVPLTPDAPALQSLLRGLDAATILLERRHQAARLGVEAFRRIGASVHDRLTALQTRIETLDESVRDAAQYVAGSHFPMGRLLKLMVEASQAARPPWLRRLGRPFALLSRSALRLHALFRSTLKRIGRAGTRDELRNRADLERERMDAAAERLLDRWRAAFDNTTRQRLAPAACQAARQTLRAAPLPGPVSQWDDFVRADLRDWMTHNPRRRTMFLLAGMANDLLLTLGGAAMVVDYTVFGGFGTTGMVMAAGSGSALCGLLLKLFEQWQLKAQLEKADARWRALRGDQVAERLRSHLADPLLRTEWETERQALKASLRPCEEACDELERLRKEWRHDEPAR
jgi:energy-coupling factor transporter ATP-binding protein EcfA2